MKHLLKFVIGWSTVLGWVFSTVKINNKMASDEIQSISDVEQSDWSWADQRGHNYPLEDRQVGRWWIKKRRRRRRIVQLACIGAVIEIWAESNKSRRSYDGRAKSGLPTDSRGGEGKSNNIQIENRFEYENIKLLRTLTLARRRIFSWSSNFPEHLRVYLKLKTGTTKITNTLTTVLKQSRRRAKNVTVAL